MIFISETDTEWELKMFLGRKKNRIRKASIMLAGFGNGNGMGIQGCLKNVFATVIIDIFNE